MPADPPVPAIESLSRMSRHSMVILATLGVCAALKLTAHILVPLLLAVFLIIIAWPMKNWLDRRLPQSLSYAGSLIALTFVVAAILGVMWVSAAEITEYAPTYQPTFESFLRDAKQELSMKGVDTRGKLTLTDIKNAFMGLAKDFKDVIIMVCVMLSYVILAIPEAARWKSKLKNCFGKESSEKILATATELSESFQSYIAAVVIGGLINAVLLTVTAFILHLDFPVTWGVLIFLLNFIPTLGPSLIPFLMALMAFIQFDSGSLMPYLVFFAVSAVQLFVGVFVDPRLQGNMLSLSPVVVLFSLTFWMFLWGIPGALLATPMTHVLIITCSRFPQTRWLACMLTGTRK